MYKNLIIGSGGFKMFNFLGCIKYLSEKKLLNKIENYYGWWAGALICVFLILKYWIEEILKICLDNIEIFEKIINKIN